jgi:serine/threonine protein kinase
MLSVNGCIFVLNLCTTMASVEVKDGAPQIDVCFPKVSIYMLSRYLQSRKIYMPRHLQGTPCADFILAAMTRDARARPSAFQLLQHPWVLHHAKVSHEEDGTGQEPPPWQKNYGGSGNSESDARGMVHHIHVTAHGTSTASNASIPSYTSLHAASALEKSLQERPGLGPPPPAAPSTSSKTALDDEDIAAAMAMAHIRVAAVCLAVGGKEPKDANLEGGGSEGLKRVRPKVHGPLPSGCTEGCTPRPRKVSRLSQNSHSQGSQESRCDITHGMVLNGESNQEATSAKALRRGISCPAPAQPARWLKKFSLKRASFSG